MKRERCIIALILALLCFPCIARAAEGASALGSAPAGGCLPLFFDETPPDVAKRLEKMTWIRIGTPKVTYQGSTKVTEQLFFITPEGGVLPCADEDCGGGEGGTVGVKCTGTCSGSGCKAEGCTVSGTSCSACSCTSVPGSTCSSECTCKKEVT